jgi:hypothetical protein
MSKLEGGQGVRALAALLPKLAAPAMRKRGFAEAALLTRWGDVVGPTLAADAVPDRLAFPRGRNSGATLHLRVAGAAALDVQHLAPQIVERINVFFGYPAVARLALTQAPVVPPPARSGTASPSPVAADRARAIDRAAADIADPALRAATAALGRAVAGASRTERD